MSRPNGYTSYRGSSREIRPTSAELVDLHVYIVPPEIWRERYNNFLNQNVTETISAGIIRVHPERVLYDLRDELEQQVGVEMLPRDFVFLKSVGRSITRLKQKQEYQLKAKHFIPPQAYAPELYLLEVSPDDRESSRTSTRPQSPFSQNPEKISQVKKAIKPKDSAKAILTKKEKSRPAKFRKDETQRRMKMNSQEICEDERRSGNKSKHRHNQSSPYHYSPLPKIRSGRSPSRRVEYNHNGDIKAESQRLTDSWGSNRDKHTPPPPQNVPRTPPRPKVSREHTPRNQTPRDESHRAPPRYSTTPTDHRKRADQSREPASGTYTNHTNEDSGINVNSPVDHFDALDRRKHEEDRRDDLHQRLHPNNEDDHQRNGDQNDDDWERRRREDEERRRREEEERRRREEEERRREEEERHRLEEERDRIPKQQLTGSDEVSTVSSENTPIASNEGSRTTTRGKQYQQSPSSAFTENSLNSNKRGNPSINRNSENYNRDQRRDHNSENYSRDQRRDRNSENYSRDQRGNPTRDQNYSDNYNREQWGDTSINQNSENYNREQRGNPLINQNSGNYNRGKGGNHSVNPNSGNFNREQDRYPGINQDSENYHSDHSQPYSDNSVHSHKDRMKVPGGTDKDFGNSYNNKGRKKDPQNSGNSMNYSQDRLKIPETDLNRFPSPPPLQINDSSQGHETESSKQNKKAEKERLLKELEAAREARRAVEKQREELVKKAKLMQTKTQNRRNHARDLWKKRYFEEKKKTPPLEEQCNRLRHELDIIHRKLMNTLEGPSKEKSTRLGDLKPSQKNNYKIQATRLTHEIDDMRRRLENAKMKLTAEMKLRNQAETELRALRAELTQQKIQLTLSRKEQLAKLTPTTHDSRLLTSSYS
ncbi:inner centromere protein-like isoform X2 [Saccostrea cucullata]|uniref:inner centromere protein-like isoform X2 n=1 Tax=Saccostrea cuccullata TaxID=36930 RepID=UPI002ED4AAB0